MVAVLIFFVYAAYVIGNLRGEKRGWDDGIRIARHWESMGRDWRMLYDLEVADSETERAAIREVRELNKMYDGV